ncbi:TlpA disulfide reductase family protein [uncultured Meiothermus sp.]|jgi:peroxiredoxin|uniref:TlpA family protein disulfide reductase n=1 Tax=uncultured Meiothermus sp. TaxID=157471 RepID=UPI002603C6F2|nr:TlpA disulfide reductase family protein [uncultured Meiothermus sp.]
MKSPKADSTQPPQTKPSKRLLTVGIPALVVAGMALLLLWNPYSNPAATVGQRVPDFSLTDLEGRPLEISALREKPTLFYFSAAWCVPCRAETRELARLYGQYRHQFQVVWISIDPFVDSKQNLLSHRSQYGHTDFRYALDSRTDPLVLRYRVQARGSMVLVNPQGEIIFRGIRAVSDPRFLEVLHQAVGRS